MKDKVKIGLVGTGAIGQVHTKAHAEVGGTELCITAMIRPERAKELSRQYGARFYPSFMMKGNPLDIGFRILGTQRSIEYSCQPEEFALHMDRPKKTARSTRSPAS